VKKKKVKHFQQQGNHKNLIGSVVVGSRGSGEKTPLSSGGKKGVAAFCDNLGRRPEKKHQEGGKNVPQRRNKKGGGKWTKKGNSMQLLGKKCVKKIGEKNHVG